MTCAQAGMKANASGLTVVVMWNYFVAPISFSSVCILIQCSSERRSWMLSCGPEEGACYWQKTWNLCVFLSWTNSEFAVPIALSNSSLSPPSSTVEFSYNLSCNGFCFLGLRLSPWVLVNVPDGAGTNKSVLGKQYAENCACGGTNDSAIFTCPSRWFSCRFLTPAACVPWNFCLLTCRRQS